MTLFTMPGKSEYIKSKKKVDDAFGMRSWKNRRALPFADNAELVQKIMCFSCLVKNPSTSSMTPTP